MSDEKFRVAVLRGLEQINGNPGKEESFDRLDSILTRQHYRLAWWKIVSRENNYRRFFNVSELAALTMERSEVFEATHDLPIRMAVEGKVSGFRIDHPDGLFDPRLYCEQLQQRYLLGWAKRIIKERGYCDTFDPDQLKSEFLKSGEGSSHRKATSSSLCGGREDSIE